MQNFNSLGCLVLEISAFQYEACHGFRAGAGVHKLFVGGDIDSVLYHVRTMFIGYPDYKVHGANMGPIWGRQDPCGPNDGPMNFSICVINQAHRAYTVEYLYHARITFLSDKTFN